jgi:hypothetical protein
MNKITTLAFALVFIFGAAVPVFADHSWGGYHWARTQNPFTLKLGDNVTSAWDAHLATASSDWSASSVLDTTVVTGLTNPKNCRAVAGRIEVCNSKYGNNGWLGIASIWLNTGGHISQGTAKMNDTYFNTPTYNTGPWKRLVMCQEVAHAFGLDHQDEAFDNANLGSCMDYTNDPDGGAGGASANDQGNEHPNAHDFEELEAIYAHLDTTTSVGQLVAKGYGAARAALKGENQDHPEFGRAIGFDAHGRADTFSRKDGEETVITHVFWLPEEEHTH